MKRIIEKILLAVLIAIGSVTLCRAIHALFTKQSPQPTVVKLSANIGLWQGSGVFIDDDLILTAGHVVDEAEEIIVVWPNGKEHKAVGWYKEPEADLGIIYIRTLEREPRAKFDDAVLGEDVWTLGNPLGIYPVLTKGIVSVINAPDGYWGQKNMIVTDCPVHPGNSGSPLFDASNNILGICSWGYSDVFNYFVDSDVCKATIQKYLACKALEQLE